MKQYYNLPASLPYIDYDTESFLSPAEFCEQCEPWLTPSDLTVIQGLAKEGGLADFLDHLERVLPEYASYERGLRTALAQTRAQKLQRDYFAPSGVSTGGEIERDTVEAFAQPDALQREMVLDRRRWAKLDELAVGHIFDIIFLVVYGLKLRLLQRKTSFTRQKGSENFSASYTSVWSGIQNHVPKTETGANT